MYKSTIIGIDQTNKKGINNKQVIKNVYLISFPFQPNCLNFMANSGISATKNKDITTIIGIKTAG
jgi:hypothetical protein